MEAQTVVRGQGVGPVVDELGVAVAEDHGWGQALWGGEKPGLDVVPFGGDVPELLHALDVATLGAHATDLRVGKEDAAEEARKHAGPGEEVGVITERVFSGLVGGWFVKDALIRPTEAGLYCERGGFYIDPMKKVGHAVTTHGHSDHARRGCGVYSCTRETEPILRERLAKSIVVRSYDYGERFKLGEVWVSLHSAGHILGSAQVRVEAGGEVWVAGGDFKREADPSCAPFEVVPCDTFISEATFGLPVYRWEPSAHVADAIFAWWEENRAAGRASVLLGYSLGKTQRVLAEMVLRTDRRVIVGERVEAINRCYREAGRVLSPTVTVAQADSSRGFAGELIVVPPGGSTLRDLGPHETAFASGWTRVMRGARSRMSRVDRGFVLSDHADWPGLLRTIEETGASRVLTMYGYPDVLAKYLREQGVEAMSLYGEVA